MITVLVNKKLRVLQILKCQLYLKQSEFCKQFCTSFFLCQSKDRSFLQDSCLALRGLFVFAFFWLFYIIFICRQSVGEFCRQSVHVGPPTLGDLSPTLGGPSSLRSTVTICHSHPSVIVRPPTLGGFWNFTKRQNLRWPISNLICPFSNELCPFSNEESKSITAYISNKNPLFFIQMTIHSVSATLNHTYTCRVLVAGVIKTLFFQ